MGAKEGNKNAEVWTLENARELFDSALELSNTDDYDFIGEIARDLGTYRELFVYLTGKFPELEDHYSHILSNLEANCFSHIKKGKIKEASGIMNLKSNYKWTDRAEHTIPGGIELHFDKQDEKL
jgi:hypothetical protein